MRERLRRCLPVWRRTAALSWPIAVQQFLQTLMRTVDIVVTGLFSPAAVAAVGLADLYSDVPRQIGSAINAGAVALVSQDTGRELIASRDQAVTQAMLMGVVVGVPFVGVGLLFTHWLFAVLGATPEVVRLGGLYLTIIFSVTPLRVLGYVGAGALQATGDTRTPMYINGAANLFNIGATVGLGLGVGPLPALGIVGVGLATAMARTIEAGAIVGAIASPWTEPSFVRPRHLTISKQIVAIGIPRFGEQMSNSFALFPFNGILFVFGAEVNAGFQIGRRIYRQVGAPVYRSIGTAAAIVVGQTVGAGDTDDAFFSGVAISALAIGIIGVVAAALFVLAEPIISLFSRDAGMVVYAVRFTQVFALISVFHAFFYTFRGGLRGAGDTRTPFYAQLVGRMGFTVGFTYVVAIALGFGLVGVYLGLVLTYIFGAVVVTMAFLGRRWAERAESLMAERSALPD